MNSLESAIVEWARPRIQTGQVGPHQLRARAETVTDRNIAIPGMWIHVHSEHEWVCSVRRTKTGKITVEVPKGTRVVEASA